MVVVNNKTGLKARGDEKETEAVLLKNRSEYWSYISKNHLEDYYTSEKYRKEVDKVLNELGD